MLLLFAWLGHKLHEGNDFFISHSSLLSKYFQVNEWIGRIPEWENQESEIFMNQVPKNFEISNSS